jgi:hypothetical protein
MDGHMALVQMIQEAMQSVGEYLPTVPIRCDVKKTTTNWGKKEEVAYDFS